MNSGGKRNGAGRPVGWRKPEAERRSESVQCRMTRAERDKAEMIGEGSAAKGLRMALSAYDSARVLPGD